MEESKSGMSWIGVLFVILVIWAIFGGGFGNGWGNRGSCAYDGCNRVSNCEVEKREIIDSARTQYLTEQQGETTRLAIRDSRDAVMGQASRIYEAQQAEKIFDLKLGGMAKDARIAQLETQIHNDAKFGAIEKQFYDCCCEFNRRLDSIECDMLKQPRLSGVAATCNGQLVPALFRNDCGNCFGRNRDI